MLVSIILTIFLLALSAIHFYWGFGGNRGFEEALPTNKKGIRVLNPGKRDSLMAGSVFLFFGLFYTLRTGLLPFALPGLLTKIAGWGIPFVFLLRAVGDFKYVGIFKKVKDTQFADLDSKFYSPLCLAIALAAFFVALGD